MNIFVYRCVRLLRLNKTRLNKKLDIFEWNLNLFFLSVHAPSICVVFRYVYLFKAHHVLHGLLTDYSTRKFIRLLSQRFFFIITLLSSY